LLIQGDFNYVLQPADITGHFITSRALQGVVQGLALTAAWKRNPRQPTFTHHSPTSATRIDRFYVSKHFAERKTGIEILPACPYLMWSRGADGGGGRWTLTW
jgi:endonuclease/exonuclease/phosphatase family metal-dependent hydrolase